MSKAVTISLLYGTSVEKSFEEYLVLADNMDFLKYDFMRSKTYPSLRSWMESRVALSIYLHF